MLIYCCLSLHAWAHRIFSQRDSAQDFSMLCCTCAGPELQGTERAEPESPVFDESFALDAQLILGSLVTPGTAARPAPPQRQPAPAEPIQEVSGSDH